MNELDYDKELYNKTLTYLRHLGKKTFITTSLFAEMRVTVYRTDFIGKSHAFEKVIKKLLSDKIISSLPKTTYGGAVLYKYPAVQMQETVEQVTVEDTKKAELLVRLNKISNELGSVYFDLENLRTNIKTTTLADFTKDELIDEIMRRVS